ncbi:MAG: HAD family hydrolase [Lachnospiraceae bacterium]|nr:HAD family hydrolase [Lachnospiraceae bacterium]
MNIKAVVFDIGNTLVDYPIPLNWSSLYRPAFERVAEKLNMDITEDEYIHICNVLTKYNTRINPREREVTSSVIFSEIVNGTGFCEEEIDNMKKYFYSFFRRDVIIYSEAFETLAEIKSKNIIIGTLSDVAYGMDNIYALEDIKALIQYIDFPYTSNDTGYRKPSGKGLILLSEKMNIKTSEMVFVGDEKKDIECAKNAGVRAVLINRTNEIRDYGQDIEIKNLTELLSFIS